MTSHNCVHETDGSHSEVTDPGVLPGILGTSNLADYLPSESTMMDDLEYSASLEEEAPREGALQNEVTINVLPDNVLLEIFHFYKDHSASFGNFTWSWRTLIHVCQRWRHVIFGSPRRLDLRLHCSDITPTRRLLDIWLPFPITISLHSYINMSVNEGGLENISVALECRDRTSVISICYHNNRSPLEHLMILLDKPFPVLTECHLISSNFYEPMPALPETFLGGSAPLLRSFSLSNIPFPTFPNFILSSTQIQRLTLISIPDSGYISPEIMATCLAVLPNLRDLSIEFRSASRPVQRPLPPLKRASLPTLTSLSFEGGSEYFEDFIARIDTPQPALLSITFFTDSDFISETPRLHDFLNRTEKANRASLQLDDWRIRMVLESQAQFQSEFGIKFNGLDRQLSLMMQTFIQRLPLLSHVEHFQICEPSYGIYFRWQESQEGDPDLGRLQLLELFRLLISVQSLYVSKRFVPHVTATLKELTGEMTMEVLPALHSLSLEGLQPSGPVQDAIQSFVTARQLTNHPVVIQP